MTQTARIASPTYYTAFCGAQILPQPRHDSFADAVEAAQRCLSTSPAGRVTIRRDTDCLLVTPAQVELHETDIIDPESVADLFDTYGQPDDGR